MTVCSTPLSTEHAESIIEKANDSSLNDSDSEEEDYVFENQVSSDDGDADEDEILEESYLPPTSQEVLQSPAISSEPNTSHGIICFAEPTLLGRNNHIWSTTKDRSSGRSSSINTERITGVPKQIGRNIVDPLICFKTFITDQIIEELVKWTNVKIISKREKLKEMTTTYRDTSVVEIKALIGMLTMTAFMKSNHLSANELFNASNSGNCYVSVMSKERFELLLSCLRMDDKLLRPSQDDPFVPVRKLWDLFIDQCSLNYEPGTHLTVDDQLLGFRGRCPFRTHTVKKPIKHGIKFSMLCDSSTNYLINALPCLGKSKTKDLPLGEIFVKELTKTVHGTNRNITCNNWFTSVPLAKNLLEPPYKLTLVGSIKANKREIPKELMNTKGRPVGSSVFCFDGPLTLVSYKPSSSKIVYLLSSYDEDTMINPVAGKPKIIELSNETKGAVKSFNQMCISMSCSRKTNRWPMAVFFGMLNMAFVNSYIIYCHNLKCSTEKPQIRTDFMKSLSSALTSAWMLQRLESPSLPLSLRECISSILSSVPLTSSQVLCDQPEPRKRRLCGYCNYKKRRMTRTVCYKCKKPICGEHNVDVCQNCT